MVPSDPSSRVVDLGSNVTFTCFYLRQSLGESICRIQWLVNQSDFNLTNAVSEFTRGAGGAGALYFFDLPQEYNNTSIQCKVVLSSGHYYNSTETTLLLQGNICSQYN